MTQTIKNTYSTFFEYRRQVTSVLMALCLVASGIYALNLYRVISHTLAMEHLSEESVSIQSRIDVLDEHYLSLSKAITPDVVTAHGFTSAPATSFVSRTQVLGRASLGYGL